MRRVPVWLPLAAALLSAGCPASYTPHEQPPEEPPYYENVDILFVPEPLEDGRTRTVFSTNNEQYWTLEGTTVWAVWDSGETAFSSRTVTMGKSTGYSGGGYGMVFCQGEYDVDEVTQPVMLVVMVNNEGYYLIGKATGAVFTDFGWWKWTPYLQRGAGAGNEVTVSYEEETGEHRLDINGYFIERFRDEDEPVLRSGKNGYIVVITPFDQFPQTVVTVYFMEDR